MTLTPGAYLKCRRTAHGLSIEKVAEKLSTVPRVAEHARADQLRLIEADAQPASFTTIVALRHVFRFDLAVLARLAEIQLGAPLPAPRLCRICGCSDNDACPGVCGWTTPDLCSSCVGAPIAGVRAA